MQRGYVEDHGSVDYDHRDRSTNLEGRIQWSSTRNGLDFDLLVEFVAPRDGEMDLQRYVLSSLCSQSRWENVNPTVLDTTNELRDCDSGAKDLTAKKA